MFSRSKRVKLRAEHAEHSGLLRVITLGMAWAASIALGLATGDMIIAVILTMVITGGHLVSWRTRTWRSARWQLVLLIPVSVVAMLLVPSLPQAFEGDWLHPMRYLQLLQALASFYLHSRASLYTAQTLSGIVLLVSSQIAFDSGFLLFFFAFFVLHLVFLSAATRTDAIRGAIGIARWPGGLQRAAWGAVSIIVVAVASLGAFLLLPWGSISPPGATGSMLPLTGQAIGDSSGGEGDAPTNMFPLTGSEGEDLQPGADQGSVAGQLGGPSEEGGAEFQQGVGDGALGDGTPGSEGAPSGLFAGDSLVPGGGLPGEIPTDGTVPNPTVAQVRSPIATYWRGQSYSTFDGTQWLPDRSVPLERARGSDRARYAQTFFMRAEQETPILGYSPVGWIPVGDFVDPRSLEPGDVYRVISERRNFHPVALHRAPRPAVVNRDPGAKFSPRVQELARQVTLGASDRLGKALAVTQYLRSNYRYVATNDPWEPAQTTEQFLFGEHRAGNAFDFAAAQTALVVASGAEARLVTGYLPGELDPLSGTYVVRASDAHAWTEVNFGRGTGWVPFDGNPREDGQAATTVRSGAAGAIAGLFDQRIGDEVRDAVAGSVQKTVSIAATLFGPLALLFALGVVAVAVRWLMRRRRAKRADAYTVLEGDQRREVIRAYERMMRDIRGQIIPRWPGETLNRYFGRVAQRYPQLWERLALLREQVNEAAYRPSLPAGASATEAIDDLRTMGERSAPDLVRSARRAGELVRAGS